MTAIGDGSFLRESFSLRRNQSFCSVHGSLALNRNQSFDRFNAPSLKPSLVKHNQSCSHEHAQAEEIDQRTNTSFHHFRYVVVFLCGIALGFMSFCRLSITVAILNMVNQTHIYHEENPSVDLVEYFGEDYVEVGEFDWSNEKQQLIISYYMIAYTLPQLFCTKLAIKMGVRWSMPLSLLICAVSCLLTPILAYEGWQYVTILRLFNGLGASAILPLMVYVVETWMPPSESAIGLAMVQFVQYIMFTVGPLVFGTLSDIHWKWAFYVPGLITLFFCLIWIYLVTDEPGMCKFISKVELDIICGCDRIIKDEKEQLELERKQSSIQNQLTPVRNSPLRASMISTTSTLYSVRMNSDKKLVSISDMEVPWTRALRVPSFYALACVWVFWCSSFGSLSFLIPTYMRQVLKVPISENGMLCFLTNCGCIFACVWPQPVLGLFQNKLKLSLTAARRLVMAFICLTVIVTLTAIARYHQYQVLLFSINRMIHLSVDTVVTSTVMSQYAHAGISSIVFSVINSVGNLSTVFFCMAVGEFLDITGQSKECWSWILVTMAVLNCFVLILYTTIIRSEPIDVTLKDKATRNNSTGAERC